jgi:antitoxin PrlF
MHTLSEKSMYHHFDFHPPGDADMKAIVAERGQVTIPKLLRERLGIRPGTALQFSARDGTLVAQKVETDPVSSVYGCLRGIGGTDRFMRELRGISKS